MNFEPLHIPEQPSEVSSLPPSEVPFEPLQPLPVEATAADSAFDQGYRAGVELATGQASALASALRQAEQARGEQLQAQARRLEVEAASLACQIAGSLVDAELQLRPELIVGIVQGGLGDLAGAEEAIIELHPQDLELLSPQAEQLSAARLTLRADATLTPGGCRVRSQVGDIDATRETRLAQMQAQIAELSRERE